jgi:NAD(P)-dependent dehydrogenase (short-subunit alcohol dehydrogenase family)
MSLNIDSIKAQKGKVAIVTGANSGLGQEITIGLAKKQIKVIMACRNIQKAESAKADILNKVPDADLVIMTLDLMSLNSVRSFATEFKSNYNRLDYLIENAGIMIPPFVKTEDGFESQMGVNFFSHFLLTKLLFPIVKFTKGARIITTSSIAHEGAKIDFNNLNAEKSYSKIGAYGQSKLACLMFAYELQDRLDKSDIDAIALSAHPGVSPTNLFNNLPKFVQFIMPPFLPLFTHKPDKAAQPMLFAALSDEVKGGDYIGPTGFRGMKGEPGKVTSKPQSFDKDVAKKLWTVTEELVGEKFIL